MITIVVPVYNMEKYLPDCLDSIKNQTYKNFEVLIINDGSTDSSGEIADNYVKENATDNWYAIHQVNKGLPSARNTGIMAAEGDFVLFIDSDDMLLENALATFTMAIELSNADIIASSFKCFGLANEEIILMENPQLEDFRIGNRIGSCVCIRLSALVAVGGYQPKMTFGYEDLALTCDLLSRGYKLVTIPEVLWLYRVKEHSMALAAKDHHKELLNQINFDVPKAKLSF